MVVTFCGHSQFQWTAEYESKVLTILEEKVGNQPADMFLGGYGNFDNFAYNCCKKYKSTHENISLVFVTPYMNIEYQRNHLVYIVRRVCNNEICLAVTHKRFKGFFLG